MPSSVEAAADLLTTALNAARLGVCFTRNRWPKYALKDLSDVKADVVAEWPAMMDPHDDASVATEIRLAVLMQRACEKSHVDQVDELTALVERVARWMAKSHVAGLGYPIEPLTIGRIDDLLDQGHFCAGIGAVYRVYRDHAEDE